MSHDGAATKTAPRERSSRPKRATPLSSVGKAPQARLVLGPGLHAAHVDLASPPAYRVRSLTGERFEAVLGDGVDPELVDECLRGARLVILGDTDRGPAILGALQTSRSLVIEPDGTAVLRAKGIRLQAEQTLVLEAGTTSIRIEESGAVRAQGDRMVIDMGSHVRVLSALVELP